MKCDGDPLILSRLRSESLNADSPFICGRRISVMYVNERRVILIPKRSNKKGTVRVYFHKYYGFHYITLAILISTYTLPKPSNAVNKKKVVHLESRVLIGNPGPEVITKFSIH